VAERRDTGLDADDDASGDHVDVVALVLGQVDPQRRAELTAHLLACSTCRREHDEMTATVSDLLPVVPAVQPPLGFDERVLGGLGLHRTRRRPVRSRAGLVLAAAALVVILTGLVARTIDRDDGDDGGSVAIGEVSVLELVDGGDDVGTVSIGEVEGGTVMVVALVTAPDGASYRCRTTFSDGTMAESEPWPADYGAWIVPLPPSASPEIDTVELLVGPTDVVWSTASFGETGS